MQEKVFLEGLKKHAVEGEIIYWDEDELKTPVECFIEASGKKRMVVIRREADYRTWVVKLPNPKLVEISDHAFTIYSPTTRDLLRHEKDFLAEWYRQKPMWRARGVNLAIVKHDFFQSQGYEYLLGKRKVRGKFYDFPKGKVIDDNIPSIISTQITW